MLHSSAASFSATTKRYLVNKRRHDLLMPIGRTSQFLSSAIRRPDIRLLKMPFHYPMSILSSSELTNFNIETTGTGTKERGYPMTSPFEAMGRNVGSELRKIQKRTIYREGSDR